MSFGRRFPCALRNPWPFARANDAVVPWTLSILAGRVSLDDHGRGAYKDKPKLRPEDEWSLTRSGVNVTPSVKTTARIMIATRCACVHRGGVFGVKRVVVCPSA